MPVTDTRRVATIAALVRDGMYPVDERSVASAICARAALQALVPASERPRAELREKRVRSFHPSRDAPSFRLAGGGRRRS